MKRALPILMAILVLSTACASAERLPWNQFGKDWIRNHDFFITAWYASNSPDSLDNGLYEDCGFQALSAKFGPSAGYELPNYAPSVGLYKDTMLDADRLDEYTLNNITASSAPDEDCSFYVRDEPDYLNDPDSGRIDLIPGLTTVANWIRTNRPNALVHINIDSSHTEPYVGPPYALPTNPSTGRPMTRDEYIISNIKPDIHFWDHYPYKGTELYANGEDGYWFACVVGGKHSADEYGLPYACTIGAFRDSLPWYRDPSESELRMNVFSSLAAGYKGFNYFYFNPWPSDRADYGILYKDGTPTTMYYWIKDINPEVRVLGEYMRFLECSDYRFIPGKTSGVTHATPYVTSWWIPGPPVSYYTPTFQFLPNAAGNSHITGITVNGDGDKKDGVVGFLSDDGGRKYFMLTNLYRGIGLNKEATQLSFTITFDNTVNTIYRIDRLTGQEETLNLTNHQYTVTLPGGTGDLFGYNHLDMAIPTAYPRGSIATGTYAGLAPTTLQLSARAGTTHMRFRNRLGPWGAWETFSGTKLWTVTGADGPTRVYVQYKKIDKMSASYAAETILDKASPVPGTASAPAATNGSITVTYSGASDSLSGLKMVYLWYRKDGGDWMNSGLTSTSASGSFSFAPSGIGTYYFDLVAEDNAANRSAAASGIGDDSTVYCLTPVYFVDNFDCGNTSLINSNLSLRQNGGSVGLVVYEEWYKYSSTPVFEYESQMKNNALYLEPGGAAHNYAVLCSPNHNFTEGTALDISFRMKPPGDAQGCVGAVIGAPKDQYITGNTPAVGKGIGIRVWQSGLTEILTGGTMIANRSGADVNADGWYDVRVTVDTPAWNGSTAKISVWIDGASILADRSKQVWENYITFQNEVANNRITQNDDGAYIDDLVIIQLAQSVTPISIAEVKAASGNVATTGVVTANFGDYFYIEAEDRSIGIRVAKAAHGTSVNRKVLVSGSASKLASEEWVIDAISVSDIGGPIIISPLGATNKSLGGGSFGLQPGVTDGSGLNNIGLFVKTMGRVSNGSGNTFNLDDGSGVAVNAILSSGIGLPSDGSYVVVTGIVSCKKDTGGAVRRVILVTSLTGY